MGSITRYDFLGSEILFVLLALTGVGIPIAVLYLLRNTVAIEEKMENPTDFLRDFAAGRRCCAHRP